MNKLIVTRLKDGTLVFVSELECVSGAPREILAALHRHEVPEDEIVRIFLTLKIDLDLHAKKMCLTC